MTDLWNLKKVEQIVPSRIVKNAWTLDLNLLVKTPLTRYLLLGRRFCLAMGDPCVPPAQRPTCLMEKRHNLPYCFESPSRPRNPYFTAIPLVMVCKDQVWISRDHSLDLLP